MSNDTHPMPPASSLNRTYDAHFATYDAYRDALPDPQNNGRPAVVKADAPIAHVGVSNFRLPLRFARHGGSEITLEASILGSVPCPGGRKGINMSRIVRSFYDHKDQLFSLDSLEPILRDYCAELDAEQARLKLSFNYPIEQHSLRSGMTGTQFYQSAFEGLIEADSRFRRRIEFDFVYSSACPCSADLAEHAELTRSAYSVPHSQRSKARVWIELAPGENLSLESIQRLCLSALKTETQVLVRREDEQAFAELNGAHLKFVEDAARQPSEKLESRDEILDYRIACSHLESLHSHDAIAVMVKGIEGGYTGDFDAFATLVV